MAGDPAHRRHVFLSYVREDADRIDQIQRILEASGIRTWRDTEQLWPGDDWRLKLREAIADGSLVFLAFLSPTSVARPSSYQNEELVVAIEQIRRRPPGKPWLIPVRLGDCQLPAFDLGGGRTLDSIHRADLFGSDEPREMARLVEAIKALAGLPVSADARPESAGPDEPAPATSDGPFQELEWHRLLQQVRTGSCTPVIGAGACVGVLPMGSEVSRGWAAAYDYPFEDGSSLPAVMDYVSHVEQDPVTVKERLVEDLAGYGQPDYSNPTEPHALLASLPFKVYLTTNYTGFMTKALEQQGKRPVTAVCPWYRSAEDDPLVVLPTSYAPSSDEPLVYHLNGTMAEPRSLVLTESDHLEFLVNLTSERGRRTLPPQILPALTRHPLMFIGYSVRDWSFRVLFNSLGQTSRRRHFGVQLTPYAATDVDQRRRAETYLSVYLARLNMSVFWGTARDFCVELAERLQADESRP